LRSAAAELKRQAVQAQTQTRSRWAEADRLLTEATTLLQSATLAHSTNETLLAQATAKLVSLEADGLTVAARQERVAECRKESDTAADALRKVDADLGARPADAPDRAARLLERIAELEMEIQLGREAYQQEEAAVKAILCHGPYTSLATAEEEVRQFEHEEAEELLRLNAIERLKAAVDSAKATAIAGIAAPVEARATELLERLSGRPLARVRLGGGMAVDSIQPEGADGDAPVEQMSAGEQEQIYFATRLALAEVLAGQERQVLVLDDPLVNTDADRLARALRLIDEQRTRLQIVILTCHPGRYLELPNTVARPLDQLTAAALASGGEDNA
jgi:DNA repair exonuclease SbcCD ATPase subunit